MYSALVRDDLVVYALLEKIVKNYVRRIWDVVPLLVEIFPINCSEEGHAAERIRRMPWNEDEVVYNCEYCMSIYFLFTFVIV